MIWPSKAAILIRLSSFVFLHAAFSAWQVTSAAKAHGVVIPSHFSSPLPLNIIVEALVAFIFLVIGVSWSATPLKDISWSSEMATRSIDSEDSRLSFANVRHRGSILFTE
ncbi:hypothetical protein T439DRAFT_357759 [Meredithblackwellia eburnea MCA 4105]